MPHIQWYNFFLALSICGWVTLVPLGITTIEVRDNSEAKRWLKTIFIITVITTALAAGLTHG